MAKDDFKHEIINIIGTISEGKKGWKKELTRISWNGAEPKYDIRSWSDDHQKMSIKNIACNDVDTDNKNQS